MNALEPRTHPAVGPLFLCDVFADERFKGNPAGVCLVPTSVYCMEWSSVSSLEASFGRGEPDRVDAQLSEHERDTVAQRYAEERRIKMGRSFQTVSSELGQSETGFIFRLPASRVRAVQEKIKVKADEFENEYEEKLRTEDEERLRATSMAPSDLLGDSAVGADSFRELQELQSRAMKEETAAREAGTAAAAAATTRNTRGSLGLIPSTSFSIGSFGASFLDTRGASVLSLAAGQRRTRRLYTQWFGLRLFSPRAEHHLCGHAALAAAHVIFETSRLGHYQATRHLVEHVPVEFYVPSQTDVLCFVMDAGVISVRRKDDAEVAYQMYKEGSGTVEEYEIHMPSTEAVSVHAMLPAEFAEKLAAALGLPYGAECIEDVALAQASGTYVVRLQQALQVFQCKPDELALRAVFDSAGFQDALKQHHDKLAAPQGLAVTALNNHTIQSGRGADAEVISRFFAPWLGLLEDPVTCSAHAAIAPYMIRHRQGGHFRVGDRVRCFQASTRGGYITCIIIGRKAERIAMVGNVVTFVRGTATFQVED